MTRPKQAPTRPPMSEKQLGVNFEDACRKLGWRYYHTFRSQHSVAGFPDYVLVKDDRLIFAELKSPKGKVTDVQGEWLTELFQCGDVECYIWRPADWDSGEILRVLQGERAA